MSAPTTIASVLKAVVHPWVNGSVTDRQKALSPDAVFKAVEGVNRRAKGGYAVVCAVLGLGLGITVAPLTATVMAAAGLDPTAVVGGKVLIDLDADEKVKLTFEEAPKKEEPEIA